MYVCVHERGGHKGQGEGTKDRGVDRDKLT